MLQVTCAIIKEEARFMICQRSESMRLPLKWEFPGGKVEVGETLEACLIREMKEELNIEVSIKESLTPVTFHYPDFSLVLHPFICCIEKGIPTAREHKSIQWVTKEEFVNYDFAEADLPILKEL